MSDDRASLLTWRWMWPVLIVAFAARIGLGLATAVPMHPDETFQYLEQAHRLVFGYGVVPWEYQFGIRSWAIPVFVGGLLWLADALGLSDPWSYKVFVEVIFCAISLVLPVGMYRLAQGLISEKGSILVFLVGCFWAHFLLYAHKPMPGMLAMYALVWLIVLMRRVPSRSRLIAVGVLAGLIAVLRFQLLPILGVLGLLAIWRFGASVWIAYAAALVVIAIAGLLDSWFWGGFLYSFFENFRLNFKYDFAGEFFGRHSVYAYATKMLVQTGGLALVGFAGLVLLPRDFWTYLLALLVGAAMLHIPAHKEFRFLIWLLPFLVIGGVAGALWLTDRLGPRLRPYVMAGVTGFVVIVSLGFTAVRSGHVLDAASDGRWGRYNDLERIFLVLHDEKDLTGIELLTPGTPTWETLGFYGLHRPVPIYFWGWHSRLPEIERAAYRADVSHVVTRLDQLPPAGAQNLGEYGDYTLWKARYPQTGIAPAPAYDLRAPLREELAQIGPLPANRIRPQSFQLPQVEE